MSTNLGPESITTRWDALRIVAAGYEANSYDEPQANEWLFSVPLSHGHPTMLTAAAGQAFADELTGLHIEGGEPTMEFSDAASGAAPDGGYWLDLRIKDVAETPRDFFESVDRFRFNLQESLERLGEAGGVLGGDDDRAAGFFREASADRYREEEM